MMHYIKRVYITVHTSWSVQHILHQGM